ncbi:MAG TPA: GAF domain-containing protein, partial [Blastocatellia bacterium]|nr:GAF domain-containing protein [Blastocatellia bacterium]
MRPSLKKRFFPAREEQAQGCALIDKIAALAQSSADLNTALRCAADEIARTLGLGRTAILLRHESSMRLVGDSCKNGMGPVEREKLRQLDLDITRDLGPQFALTEIADAGSDPRVSRRFAPAASLAEEPAIKCILIVPIVIDSEPAGTVLLYQSSKRRWSAQEKHLAQNVAS